MLISDLAMANQSFGESILLLAKSEPEGPLVQNLGVLGGIHKKLNAVHEKQVVTISAQY